jgi:hypothetical protein
VARDFIKDNQYEFPIRIDPPPADAFNTLFAAWPLRFYIMNDDSVCFALFFFFLIFPYMRYFVTCCLILFMILIIRLLTGLLSRSVTLCWWTSWVVNWRKFSTFKPPEREIAREQSVM